MMNFENKKFTVFQSNPASPRDFQMWNVFPGNEFSTFDVYNRLNTSGATNKIAILKILSESRNSIEKISNIQ